MLAWNHNAYYERLLLRAVPAGAARVLDVGCGTGALAARLAQRVDRVDAADRDAVMVHAAQASTPANVTVWLAGVTHDRLPAQNYDAIVSMSALHHLPLQPALRRLGAALRPSGVLAVVALPRTELPRELPIEAAAAIWHLAVGAGLRSTDGQWPHGLAHGHHPEMPIRDPELTIRQVRRAAEQVLPGSVSAVCCYGATYSPGKRQRPVVPMSDPLRTGRPTNSIEAVVVVVHPRQQPSPPGSARTPAWRIIEQICCRQEDHMRVTSIVANLSVAEIDAAKSFYTDYLGLSTEEFNLGWVARCTSPATGANVQLVTRDASASEDSVVSVHTDDVEGAYQEAQQLGYEIVHPLTTEPWGVRRFFVRAPDGNVLNIVNHRD